MFFKQPACTALTIEVLPANQGLCSCYDEDSYTAQHTGMLRYTDDLAQPFMPVIKAVDLDKFLKLLHGRLDCLDITNPGLSRDKPN